MQLALGAAVDVDNLNVPVEHASHAARTVTSHALTPTPLWAMLAVLVPISAGVAPDTGVRNVTLVAVCAVVVALVARLHPSHL
jgi:hypothetical protein